MTINTTFAVSGAGAITGTTFVPGTDTRFSTLELHQWLQDLADDAAPTGDDLVSILGGNPSELAGKRNAARPMALTLLNGVNISDALVPWFKFGSIEQNAGEQLYTGLKVLGSLVAGSPIFILQNGAKITKYWSDSDSANFQILVKAKATSGDTTLKNITVFSRKYGQSYSHFDVDLSAGGEQAAALSTSLDSNVVVGAITPAIAAGFFSTAIGGTATPGTQKITLAYGDTTQDLGGGAGSLLHKGTITLDGTTPLSDAYQALMWACSELSTITFNTIPGWRYRVLPGQAYAENAPAPFGSFAGGKWFVAQGWWLTGVMAGDSKNYQLVSHTGTTETPPTSISIQVSGVAAGDYVLVGRDSGTDFAVDTTLASLATAGATTVTLTAAPVDTPVAPGAQTCYIRINGKRHTYTSRAGNVISGLSPAVPAGNYASGLPVFIPFIDEVASGSSISSASFQYDSAFTCRYRVRKGGTPSIVPFESTLSVTSNGGSGTAVRNADE